MKTNGTEMKNLNHADFADNPWSKPADTSFFMFLLRWPITFVLWLTIPDCRKHPKLTAITFLVCIAWIGIMSYVIAMLITIIGKQNTK